MFILEATNPDQDKVYYTSSLSPETEVNQIKPLIKQILGQEIADNIQVIEPADKQKNT